MDKDRAKELLRAIHSCQDSGCEKDCEAACEMLEADPELQAWFENEMEGWSDFDKAVAGKFDCCCGPEDQKRNCLGKKSGGRLFKLLIPAMAAAALFLVGFFVFGGFGASPGVKPLLVESSGSGLSALRADLARMVSDQKFELHHVGAKIEDLQSWLGAQSAPSGDIKACVLCKKGVGCAVLTWADQKVSMVCFRDESYGGDGLVHLFVIDRSAFREEDLVELGQPSRQRNLATGGWSDDNAVYLVVGDQPDVSIDSLL